MMKLISVVALVLCLLQIYDHSLLAAAMLFVIAASSHLIPDL